jgi:methanogen homocitrate synthase
LRKPWISDKWIGSPYNFDKDVRIQMNLPRKVRIHDATLRDGEQQTGVVFRKNDKIKIAQSLNDLGAYEIEVGMPAVSSEDFEATKSIARLGLDAEIYTFSLPKREHVDLARKCDVFGVVMEVLMSRILIENGLGWTKQKVMKEAIDAIRYAKTQGLRVNLFLADSTRTDERYLKGLLTAITSEVEVDTITVVDSLGVASPQGFAHLVKLVKGYVPAVPIGVHCHNSLGLATANALSGVAAGAEYVHATVNGISEGAGLTALEEVVMGLRLLYGVDSGIRVNRLFEVSRLVESLSGVRVGNNKPVVGKDVFAVESGIPLSIHKRFSEMGLPHGHLPFLPELVGNKFRIAVGKKSGHHGIEWRLEQLDIKATEDQVKRILDKTKTLAIKHKRALADDEFKSIVDSVLADKTNPSRK